MRRWPRWSFAASAEKRSAKYAPHERERRRAGKCSSRGGGFAYCALDGMRRQLPRAPTPVPGLYPARYNLSPANNSRSYNLHRRSTASARTNAFNQNHLRAIGDLANSNLWFGKSCDIARQQVEPAQPAQPADFALSETCPAPIYGRAGRVILRGSKRKPHCGRHCRLRTIGDLPGSNLWPGRSCNIARQQKEAALRPALPTSHYRRPARLQFMAGQVV